MQPFIAEILPRQNDDGSVMNVKVQFKLPENDHRFNTVDVIVFIDKNISSMEDINRLAIDGAFDVLKKIISHHP